MCTCRSQLITVGLVAGPWYVTGSASESGCSRKKTSLRSARRVNFTKLKTDTHTNAHLAIHAAFFPPLNRSLLLQYRQNHHTQTNNITHTGAEQRLPERAIAAKDGQNASCTCCALARLCRQHAVLQRWYWRSQQPVDELVKCIYTRRIRKKCS